MSLLENTNELFFKFQHFLLFLAVSLFHRKSPDHLLSDYGVRTCLVYLFVYSALKRKVCVYIILEIVLGSIRKHLEPSSNLFLGGGMFPLLLPILVLNWYLTTPNLAPLNNKHVLSHSVFGSGIWVWLSWGHLAQGHSQGCSQFISQGLCHLKENLMVEESACNPSSCTRLLAGIRSSLAVGFPSLWSSLPWGLHREAHKMGDGFPPSKWERAAQHRSQRLFVT